MKRFFAISLFSTVTILCSQAAEAHKYTKLCETIPVNAKQNSFIATDDKEQNNYVKVGDTEGYIEGRNNRYLVNQHNGQPIVFTTSCEGKLLADNGPKLRGLLITTPEYFRKTLNSNFQSPGFYIQDLKVITDNDPAATEHMQEYENETINEALLNNIIRDTVVFMRDNNQPVVDVYFPEQDVTDGYIVALVQRAVADKIIVNGNEYYTDEEISRFVTVKPGEYIWSDDLSKDLRWINSYPYRQVDVIFKPGEKQRTTDVIFETKDMYPFRLFGGVDNYGSKTTSQNQFYAGFSYGDLWDLDHELIYSFGSSFDLKNFNSHTLQYIAPLPELRHKLSFTGNVSSSEPKSPTPVISQEGTNYTINLDYEMPIYDYGLRGFTQSFSFGTDYKRLENDIEFGGVSVFNSKPELVQFYATYDGTKTSAKTLQAISTTLVSSPGGLFGNNEDDDFELARTGADASYTYGKALYDAQYTDETTTLTFRGLFRGQYSIERLLSSEQATISGPGAVRGFSTGSVRRDNAFISTLEIASPYVPVLDTLIGASIRDRVQGFVFYDRGVGTDVNATGDGVTLDSAGVGARFGIGNNLSGTIEYGNELHDEFNDGKDRKVNFRINASY